MTQLICKEWIDQKPTGHIRYFPARIDRNGTIFRTGYGNKIRTDYMVRIANRWRRVYAACYGNASTLYIGKPGAWEWVIEGERE